MYAVKMRLQEEGRPPCKMSFREWVIRGICAAALVSSVLLGSAWFVMGTLTAYRYHVVATFPVRCTSSACCCGVEWLGEPIVSHYSVCYGTPGAPLLSFARSFHAIHCIVALSSFYFILADLSSVHSSFSVWRWRLVTWIACGLLWLRGRLRTGSSSSCICWTRVCTRVLILPDS